MISNTPVPPRISSKSYAFHAPAVCAPAEAAGHSLHYRAGWLVVEVERQGAVADCCCYSCSQHCCHDGCVDVAAVVFVEQVLV